MESLRPCPFCASSGIFWDRGGMECPACAARGPANEKRGVCVSAWNTRPIEDALTAQLQASQAEYEALHANFITLGMANEVYKNELREENTQLRAALATYAVDPTSDAYYVLYCTCIPDGVDRSQIARDALTPPAAPEEK